MSQYKTHAKFNVFVAFPLLFVGILYFFHPENPILATFSIAFLYSSLFMTPDLDLVHQVKLFSIRGVLTLPFRGYSLLFKHRGLSHSIIFGTLTRVLWLGGIALAALYVTNEFMLTKSTLLGFWKMYKPFIIYGFAGIFLADMCHLLLDFKK